MEKPKVRELEKVLMYLVRSIFGEFTQRGNIFHVHRQYSNIDRKVIQLRESIQKQFKNVEVYTIKQIGDVTRIYVIANSCAYIIEVPTIKIPLRNKYTKNIN